MKFYLTNGDVTRPTSQYGAGFIGNIHGGGYGSGGLLEEIVLSILKRNGDGCGAGFGNEDGDGDTWKSRVEHTHHIHPRVSANPDLRVAIQTAALQPLLHIG